MGNRSNVRAASAFVLIVASLGAAFGACTQYKSYNGQECLKDDECLAGSCVAGLCEQPPPLLTGPLPDSGTPDTGPATDSALPSEAGDDGPAAPGDSGNDSAIFDSGHDAADAADAADASNDVNAPSDSSDDASDAADDDATGARDVRPDSLFA